MVSPSNLQMVFSSIRRRGLWSGARLAFVIARSGLRKRLGEHHVALFRGILILVVVLSGWLGWKGLHGMWGASGKGELLTAVMMAAVSLAGVAIGAGGLILRRIYRSQLWLRTIQFLFFSAVVSGVGYLGFDWFVSLYSNNPAPATFLGVVLAVMLFAFKDVVGWFPRAILIRNMAVPSVGEFAALSEVGRWRVAIHEAGHALCYGLCTAVPEDGYVSIDSDMNELVAGMVAIPPPREPTDYTRQHIEWQLIMMMSGVAAEEVFFGDGSMLGGGDMEGFNLLAMGYLMAGHGAVFAMKPETEVEETTNRAAIARLRDEIKGRACAFIAENRELCEVLARDVLEHDYLDCEQIAKRVGAVIAPQAWRLVAWPESLAVVKIVPASPSA